MIRVRCKKKNCEWKVDGECDLMDIIIDENGNCQDYYSEEVKVNVSDSEQVDKLD